MRPKVACYCMTRNIYHKVIPSLNSLLINSDVDRVWLVTEDDDVGFELPEKVSIRNVSGQTYFPPNGANYNSQWTWMVLMRTALAKVFPEYDRILSLDLDTIVDERIDELWDTPIENCYLAGVPEPQNTREDFVYINGGVVLWDLAKLRDGMCDGIIRSLNEKKWIFPDQNCVSHLCQGKIYHLNSCYNYSRYSAPCRHPKIWHFAARRNWYETEPLVKKYLEVGL